jgi:quinol-cytochrome oxidoreductase complex cytochrome b subunit
MLLWHVVLLPVVIVALAGAHLLLVRRRGVVAPFGAEDIPPAGRVAP